MITQYYWINNIDPVSLAYAAFLIILFSLLLALGTGFSLRGQMSSIYWLTGFWALLVVAFLMMMGWGPYFRDAVYYSGVIEGLNQPKKAFDLRLFHVFSKMPTFFSANNVIPYMVIQVFFFVWGGVLFEQAFRIFWSSSKLSLPSSFTPVLTTFFILYPATLLYSTVPLRESFLVFGMAVTFYGAVLLYKSRYRGGLWFSVGAAVVGLVRFDYLVIVLPLFLVFLPDGKPIFRNSVWLMSAAILSISIIVIGAGSIVDILESVRNSRVGSSTMSYGYVEWSGLVDMIMDAPRLVAQFVLSPFPVIGDWSPINHISLFLSLLFEIMVVCLAILSGKGNWRVFVYFFAALSLVGLFEVHAGAAVRHRSSLFYFMIPLASLTIGLFFDWLRSKGANRYWIYEK